MATTKTAWVNEAAVVVALKSRLEAQAAEVAAKHEASLSLISQAHNGAKIDHHEAKRQRMSYQKWNGWSLENAATALLNAATRNQ